VSGPVILSAPGAKDLLEAAWHGDQPPMHGIGREQELFERYHAKDRLGARVGEYDEAAAGPVTHLDGHVEVAHPRI